MSDQRTPRLTDVLKTLLERAKTEIRVALPAVVQAYDATKQTVDVQPLLQELATDVTGASSPVTLPLVPSVPVVFPGGGGFRLTFPIAQGDIVLLVFADRSIDVWSSGAGATPVDPVALGRHQLADAFALPCVHAFGSPLASAPTTGASLGADGGPTIEFGKSGIVLGNPATPAAVARLGDAVAVAPGMATWIGSVAAALSSLGFPIAPPAPPDFGTIAAGSPNTSA